jgi:hypothetical protein
MADVPYEELHGIIIGDGADGSYTPPVAHSGASQNIATAAEASCPVCNGGISVGETPCPHCGSPIDWGT